MCWVNRAQPMMVTSGINVRTFAVLLCVINIIFTVLAGDLQDKSRWHIIHHQSSPVIGDPSINHQLVFTLYDMSFFRRCIFLSLSQTHWGQYYLVQGTTRQWLTTLKMTQLWWTQSPRKASIEAQCVKISYTENLHWSPSSQFYSCQTPLLKGEWLSQMVSSVVFLSPVKSSCFPSKRGNWQPQPV